MATKLVIEPIFEAGFSPHSYSFRPKRSAHQAMDIIVGKLNQTARGWSNYFHYGHGHRKMKKVRYYMEESLRLPLRYRHKLNNRGAAYTRFPRRYIYDHLGLYKVPITPCWKGVHA